MQSRGTGSSAHGGQWRRNEYTMFGSHYLVYFKLTEGNVIRSMLNTEKVKNHPSTITFVKFSLMLEYLMTKKHA